MHQNAMPSGHRMLFLYSFELFDGTVLEIVFESWQSKRLPRVRHAHFSMRCVNGFWKKIKTFHVYWCFLCLPDSVHALAWRWLTNVAMEGEYKNKAGSWDRWHFDAFSPASQRITKVVRDLSWLIHAPPVLSQQVQNSADSSEFSLQKV